MAAVGKSGLEYDAEEALYQEVSKGSAAHGLTVMTFLKYEQRYVRGNPNLSWKLSIPKDFREHPDDELRDPSPSTTSVGDKLSGQEPKRPDDGFRTVNGQAARLHQQAAKREVQNQKKMPVARYCQKNIMCTRGHTDEERAYFAARGPKKVRKTGQPLQSGYTMYSGA